MPGATGKFAFKRVPLDGLSASECGRLTRRWPSVGLRQRASDLAPHLPTTLSSLNLSRNQIRDDGAKALAQYFPVGLRFLSLNHNRLTYWTRPAG